MPRITKDALEQDKDTALATTVEATLHNLTVSTVPTLIVGVNRKANLGNYETLDIYAGISIPLEGTSIQDLEHLSEKVIEAAEYGFAVTAKETYDRYAKVKQPLVQAEPAPAQ